MGNFTNSEDYNKHKESFHLKSPFFNNETFADSKFDTHSNILVLFVVILSICVLVNTRIVYVMIVNANRNNRYVNLLVAQFSLIIILYCDSFLVRTFEKQLVNLFPLGGIGFCESLTFFQGVLNGALPLNAIAIVYERMRAVNKPFQKIHLMQVTCGTWVVASLVSIPSIFMVTFTKHCITKTEICEERLLWKSKDITLAYEWTRFFLFYVAVSLYMAYMIYKTWGEIRSHHIPQGNRFRNWKLWPKRIQFVFLHSILFILIWLPIGTIRFVYKVLWLLEEIEKVDPTPLYLFLEMCLTFTLLIVCPLLHVLLNKDVGPFCLIPRNVLRSVCRESPLTVNNVPTITVNRTGGNWNEIQSADVRNTGIGSSGIPSMMWNLNQNLTMPTCMDCEIERRQMIAKPKQDQYQKAVHF